MSCSFSGGDALGGSEYFTGGCDSGCNGGIEGGGLFLSARYLLPDAVKGNALAIWTSVVLLGVLLVLLAVFVMPEGVASNGWFRLLAVAIIGTGLVFTYHFEKREGELPPTAQTNYKTDSFPWSKYAK